MVADFATDLADGFATATEVVLGFAPFGAAAVTELFPSPTAPKEDFAAVAAVASDEDVVLTVGTSAAAMPEPVVAPALRT